MNIEYLLIGVSIIIIIFIIKIIRSKKNKNYLSNINRIKDETIPKKIWTYWHDETLPEFISKCVENWKKYNPDYEIIILNNTNYKSYIKDCDILSYPACRFVQRVSDFMRIHALNQNGGIWIDASTLLFESLDWVLQKYEENKYEYIGYRIVSKETVPEYPVIENWFMAAPKGSRFIQLWLEKFLELNNFQTDYDYLSYIQSLDVNLQNLSLTGYLAMHYAVQYVLQKQMTIEEINKNIYLEKAEDGPFKYLHVNNWDIKKSLQALCYNKDLRTKVVKFRSPERKEMEKLKKNCIYNYI